MIYDTLIHAGQYAGIHSNLAKGLRFLTETDLNGLPTGRVDIDGDEVFALIQEYTTKAPADAAPEAHRVYADIQYLLEGEELMGVAPLETMVREIEAHPEIDIRFYEGETVKFPLGAGRFAVLFPSDAHAPCIAVGWPAPVRKCVIKVKM